MLLIFTACAESLYQKTDDGVIINIKQPQETGARKVRLRVLGDELIHVSATPEKEFPRDSSLIIVPGLQTVPFTIDDTGDSITLSTAKLKATVSKSDGGIRFKDKTDKVILAEKQGGGRSFTPIEADHTKGYSVRQLFDSPDDEAFYGLGQHQSDEFNYKGKSEELFQYNTKVSVPFVISNKNYGLLWDSYSLSRFGDSREYRQLNETFALYDKEGQQGGLTGTYVSPAPERTRLERKEESLCFEDIKGIRNLPENFPLREADVTYEGAIEAQHDGTYRFILYYAGYVKVYLDDELVVPERWRTAWNPNSYKFTFDLKAGKKVPLRIEWKPMGESRTWV